MDLGRGIYTNNAVAQAAREIARTTSVHPCDSGFPCGTSFGTSTETLATIATQGSMVPGLQAPAITCVDLSDAAPTGQTGLPRACRPGDFARVTVKSSRVKSITWSAPTERTISIFFVLLTPVTQPRRL